MNGSDFTLTDEARRVTSDSEAHFSSLILTAKRKTLTQICLNICAASLLSSL
jgi:hypothetical protein